MQKQAEMEEVFKKLKVDDLSDLDKYSELRKNVERAMTDMQGHYRELAFSKIYSNKESIRKIDKAIVDIAAYLKHAHGVYESKWRSLVKIQRDDSVIEHGLRSLVESNFKTMGSLAVPMREVDSEVVKICHGVKFDLEVIEMINRNSVFMEVDEQRVVLNSVKGLY